MDKDERRQESEGKKKCFLFLFLFFLSSSLFSLFFHTEKKNRTRAPARILSPLVAMAPHSGGPAGSGDVCSAATYSNRVLKSE